MTQKTLLTLFISILTAVLSACEPQSESKNDGKKIEKPRFHTEDNQGIWKDMADEHLPEVEIKSDTEIIASVPLVPTLKPRHYIEVLVVMEGNKQILAKKFKPSLSIAKHKFELPDNYKESTYYVVSKCNMHDMWRIQVKDPEDD